MKPTSGQIGWGTYEAYEGPFFRGSITYSLPLNATWKEKVLYVVTTTEGGRYDAINMYDQCIISAGLIQECEGGIFRLSDLLGQIDRLAPVAIAPFQAFLAGFGYTFRETKQGYRFLRMADLKPILTRAEQATFFLGCSGRVGAWGPKEATQQTPEQRLLRERAREWAAQVAAVLSHPSALAVQSKFVAAGITGFFLPYSRANLLDTRDTPKTPEQQKYCDAAIAMFTSFAANNSVMADKAFKNLNGIPSKYIPFTQDWLASLAFHLTFDCGFKIYPTRYQGIRPVIETLYGVDLPDYARELRMYAKDAVITVKGDKGKAAYDLSTPKGIQSFLIWQGCDLGPAGSDGIFGKKTTEAVRGFQAQQGLQSDGIVGPKTLAKMKEVAKNDLHLVLLRADCGIL